MTFVTDSNRPQPLWQPPPAACLTASGAASEAPSLPIHPCQRHTAWHTGAAHGGCQRPVHEGSQEHMGSAERASHLLTACGDDRPPGLALRRGRQTAGDADVMGQHLVAPLLDAGLRRPRGRVQDDVLAHPHQIHAAFHVLLDLRNGRTGAELELVSGKPYVNRRVPRPLPDAAGREPCQNARHIRTGTSRVQRTIKS